MNNLPACCTDFQILYPKLLFEQNRTEDEKDFLEAHGIEGATLAELQAGAVDVDVLTVRIKHRCTQLGDDGLCRIYETRPNVCRDFDCSMRHDCACKGNGKIE